MEQNKRSQENNKKSPTLLSIIIPVYNTHKYLDTLMWILKKQITNEVEVIIVDGSDDTYNYFKEYKNTYYYHIKNKTAGTSRNFGIEHSSGEYICFIDSDDIVSENYIEKILNKIHTSTFDYCFFSWRTIGITKGETIVTDNCTDFHWAVWSRVWNRKFIGDVRFDENLIVAEDSDFIGKLFNGKSYSDKCKKENIIEVIYNYYTGRTDNLCTLYNSGQIGKYLDE